MQNERMATGRNPNTQEAHSCNATTPPPQLVAVSGLCCVMARGRWLVLRVAVVAVLVAVAGLAVLCPVQEAQGAKHIPGLYDGDNMIVRLDADSMAHVLGGSERQGGSKAVANAGQRRGAQAAWLVEFYASWCGHCQNFAPAWRTLSQRLNTWREVLVVGAINCGDEANKRACQRHNVTGYPTIKVFPPTASNPGDAVTIQRGDISFMETQVAELLLPFLSDQPRLEPFRSVEQVVEASREEPIPFVTIIESPASNVGLRLTLHFWSAPSVARVVRVHSDGDDDQQQAEGQPEACDVHVYKSGERISEIGCDADTKTDVVGLILNELTERLGLRLPRLDHTMPPTASQPPAHERAAYFKHPHASDLSTTLHHMLAVEVASREKMGAKEVAVLRAIARAASNLPLPSQITTSTARIASWLEARDAVSRRTWQELLERYPLLVEQGHGWRQCQGSQPHYRGFSFYGTIVVEDAESPKPKAGLHRAQRRQKQDGAAEKRREGMDDEGDGAMEKDGNVRGESVGKQQQQQQHGGVERLRPQLRQQEVMRDLKDSAEDKKMMMPDMLLQSTQRSTHLLLLYSALIVAVAGAVAWLVVFRRTSAQTYKAIKQV
ncbi:hypothetical protein PTSG_06412 [Salpingoeca rosetta]|uniref:Thioredoxin domain-containing protein n=1 Tax=Salpingoeca rosetta (strain ATCC 50818 / BSB-021) TaxID=946362 RepID=F2UBY6_SALR5|nr:uncharacterized protein PTSG_06412 [Salpingoeca rosetta]EGD74401.1 hypothetical protein PTSG_06412 [Salpingoeca rosetta]|eukprot:XP_004993301.1 hypothetical protein PTSG_06412 [Salpingoeca rosetta]